MSNRFDLDAAITRWRAVLSRQEVGAGAIAELEDHLREHVARLRPALTEREAFLVAAERIGRPSELSAEILHADSMDAWVSRLRWMAAGAVVAWLLARLIGISSGLAAYVAAAQGWSLWGIAAAVLGVAVGVASCCLAAPRLVGRARFDAGLERVRGFWLGRKWWFVSGVVLAVGLLAGAIGIVIDFIAMRFIEPEQFGRIAFASVWTRAVVIILPLVILLGLAATLQRLKPRRA